MTYNRIARSIIFMILAAFTFWLGGYDFDSRGVVSFYVGIVTLAVAILTWTFPK